MIIRRMSNTIFPKELVDGVCEYLELKKFYRVNVHKHHEGSYHGYISIYVYVNNETEAVEAAYIDPRFKSHIELPGIALPDPAVSSFTIKETDVILITEEIDFITLD